MPLAPLASLLWFGPAVAPAVVAAAGATAGGAVKSFVRSGVAAAGAGAPFGGRSTRMFRVSFGVAGAAQGAGGNSRAFVRSRWDVKPGGIGQSDIESALFDVEFEPGWTMRKLMRLQLAFLAGDATVPESGAVQFLSPVDERVRIAGTVLGGARTVTTRDGS